MDASQIWRFPKKYGELFKNISNEDVGIIIKELFLGDGETLIGLNKAFYDIIKVDLDNLEKSALNGKKGGRPKTKKTLGYLNEKPQVNENQNLKEREDKDKDKENAKDNKKHIYGEFGKVKLSDDEYSKLKIRYDEKDLEELIQKLDIYIGSKGVSYKSHYLTIINWAKKKGVTEYTEKDREEQKARAEKRKKILETSEELPEFETGEKKISMSPLEQQRKYAEMKKQYFNN